MLAGVRAAEVAGRLPAPSAETLGEVFPYEPALTVLPLAEPALPEPDRADLTADACGVCQRHDEDFAWTDGQFRLASLTARAGFGVHVFMLWPRAHADLADLDDAQAADLGRMLVRVERAITRGIDGVGRVHVIRWGDGSAHSHWWFLARPAGLVQLRGTGLTGWLDVLPPLPAELVRADTARVAAELSG